MISKNRKQKIYFGIDEEGKFVVIDGEQVDWQYECGRKENEHNKVDYCPIHDKPLYRLKMNEENFKKQI